MTHTRLSYDDNANIIFSQRELREIYVLPLTSQHIKQLVSSNSLNTVLCTLTVNKKNQLFYVGQNDNLVGIFKLLYR